jgi:hypothetical protein
MKIGDHEIHDGNHRRARGVSTKISGGGSGTFDATRRIGFVGDAGVGKTAIATLVAARLAARTAVTVIGEAGTFVRDHGGDTEPPLGIEWIVEDCAPGTDALESHPERLDTVFVVATPETLGSVAAYERVAARHGLECFLVVNRFRESAHDRLRAFDGPELAEYFYTDEGISAALEAGTVPALSDWTVEAILIEALQPDRQDPERARKALDARERSIVNVEVGDRDEAVALAESFERDGYDAAYFECNCRCHDGHVLARQ